jgi:hypothetical protein
MLATNYFCGFFLHFNVIFHLIGFSAFSQDDVQLSLSFAVNLKIAKFENEKVYSSRKFPLKHKLASF